MLVRAVFIGAALLACVGGCRERNPTTATGTSAPDAAVEELRHVWASRLNVRAGPSPSAEKLGQLDIGAPVTVLERRSGFMRIRSGALTGWVPEGLLEIEAPTPEALLARYEATPEEDLATRRSLIERAAALSPTNVPVLEELVRVLERADDPGALRRARQGLATTLFPVDWDGPLLAQDGFGPACTVDGGAPAWSALMRASRGLWGRTDLVEPARASRPVTLTETCEFERTRLEGFDTWVLTRETLGGATTVLIDRLMPTDLDDCSPAPLTLEARCNGELQESSEWGTLPGCAYGCESAEIPGGRVQVFVHRVEDHYEATLDLWDEAAWIRVVRGEDRGAWVELRRGMKWETPQDGMHGEGPAAAFIRPGKDVRLLMTHGVHCHDAYDHHMVRWLPDGGVQEGRRFDFDLGDEVNEICAQ